jgi:hypothetical protein
MEKYLLFNSSGVLESRFDSAINTSIPEEAILVSDEIFLRTLQEYDGVWKMVDGELIKESFPPPAPSALIHSALSRINKAYEDSINSMTSGYPQGEIDSWSEQKMEAQAWLADNTTFTPWLNAAAASRGITKADLVTKIMDNANAFAVLHGQLTGKRQKLRDDILALGASPTQEELESVQW